MRRKSIKIDYFPLLIRITHHFLDILHQSAQLRIIVGGKGANIPHEGPQVGKLKIKKCDHGKSPEYLHSGLFISPLFPESVKRQGGIRTPTTCDSSYLKLSSRGFSSFCDVSVRTSSSSASIARSIMTSSALVLALPNERISPNSSR